MNSHPEVSELIIRWYEALQTGNADRVAALYAPEAILLPTISNKIRRNQSEIREYFEHFLHKKPEGRTNESNVRKFGDMAIHSGAYTFTLASGSTIEARFTFVYRWTGDRWLIVEHHSSRMPE